MTTLDRDAVVKAMRERLLESNFNAYVHAPIRAQMIDAWVDVLAGAVVALARPINEVKAEALENFAGRVRGELAETAVNGISLDQYYVQGLDSALGQADDEAAALRNG